MHRKYHQVTVSRLLLGQIVNLFVIQASVSDYEVRLEVVVPLGQAEPGLPDGVPQLVVAGAGQDQDQQGHGWTREQRQILMY